MKSNILQAVCLTHIGKRINHEDNFLFYGNYLTSDIQKRMSDNNCICINKDIPSRVSLFVISDGMGGHNAGEVASRICVETLAQKEKELQECFSLEEAVACLQVCIKEINDIVCRISYKSSECKGMGATLVLLVVYEGEYAILNVGDSRAYFFRESSLLQITKDHTEGQRMLDLGLLTRKELANFPARKNLNRYIGYGDFGYVLQADEYYPTIEDGIVMICSDGVSDFLSEKKILDILQSGTELENIGKKLIKEAVANQNADNTTIILIQTRG